MSNKDLDLPTQQELLAQFRCDEIASTAFIAFEAQISSLRKPIDAGSVLPNLSQSMKEARTAAMSQFDAAASRYHAGVYQRKKAELLAKMNTALSPLFLNQLKNLHKRLVKEYRNGIAAALKGEDYDFGVIVRQALAKAEQEFVQEAQGWHSKLERASPLILIRSHTVGGDRLVI